MGGKRERLIKFALLEAEQLIENEQEAGRDKINAPM